MLCLNFISLSLYVYTMNNKRYFNLLVLSCVGRNFILVDLGKTFVCIHFTTGIYCTKNSKAWTFQLLRFYGSRCLYWQGKGFLIIDAQISRNVRKRRNVQNLLFRHRIYTIVKVQLCVYLVEHNWNTTIPILIISDVFEIL